MSYLQQSTARVAPVAKNKQARRNGHKDGKVTTSATKVESNTANKCIRVLLLVEFHAFVNQLLQLLGVIPQGCPASAATICVTLDASLNAD